MENISAHESVRKMYEKLHADGVTNTFDRFEAGGSLPLLQQWCKLPAVQQRTVQDKQKS